MKYRQVRAMFAVTRASLRSIFRSPSAVIFSFVFPFIFIIVFGFIGGGGGMQTYKIVMAENADTTNELFTTLKNTEGVRILKFKTVEELKTAQEKGRIAGVLNIIKTEGSTYPYRVELKSTTSSNDAWPQLTTLLQSKINTISDVAYKGRPTYAFFDFNPKRDIAEIREYKTIDFILPGQLGFSLLSAGVFGVAFTFFNLRNTMVLKRFFATPISRTFIIIGEGLSRVIFQMITAVVIIGAGYLFFGFTLVHGIQTLFEMLFLSLIGLIIFMGFGFIVSGLAKSDSTIPPFANLITLPQFLLGGTFFSVDAFPKWLQPISKALPLTHLNTAMRSVAFEGLNLWEIRGELGILFLWGLIVYVVAVKVFKWE
jgi:ABC-2 type transport system permease protein